MKLDLNTLRAVTLGAARIDEDDTGFHFHRFTKEQEELYKTTSFADKILCTAGVKLCFRTTSRRLYIKTNVRKASTRSFFAFDIMDAIVVGLYILSSSPSSLIILLIKDFESDVS